MLTRLIVNLYTWIIEVSLWIALVASCIAGYNLIIPALNHAGWFPEFDIAWKIFGALLFPIVAFLSLAVVLGPILILIDIRESVKALVARANEKPDGALAFERKEPNL